MHKLLLCTNLAQRRHHLYCSNFGISPISFGQIATSNHDPHTIPGSPTKIVCFCIGSASKQPLPIGVMKCNQGIVVRNFLLRPLRHFNIPKRFAGDFPDRAIEIHRHREPQVLIIPGTSYSHLWSQSSISMTPGSHWLAPPDQECAWTSPGQSGGWHPSLPCSWLIDLNRLVDSRDHHIFLLESQDFQWASSIPGPFGMAIGHVFRAGSTHQAISARLRSQQTTTWHAFTS